METYSSYHSRLLRLPCRVLPLLVKLQLPAVLERMKPRPKHVQSPATLATLTLPKKCSKTDADSSGTNDHGCWKPTDMGV